MPNSPTLPKFHRVVEMYAYLIRNRRRAVTVLSMQSYFANRNEQVSVRDIQRDLKHLAEIDCTGIQKVMDGATATYRISPNIARSISLPLRKNCLLAFFLLKRLQPFFGASSEPLEELTDAVIDKAGAKEYDFFVDLDDALDDATYKYDGGSLEMKSEIIDTILAALIEQRVVDVDYFKSDEAVVTRKKLQPVKMLLYKNDLFLFCASPKNEEWNFPIKVSRIDNATLTSKTFSISPARKKAIEVQLSTSFGIFDGPDNPPQKVVLKFCESTEYYRKLFSEQRYHHSQKIGHDKRGTCW